MMPTLAQSARGPPIPNSPEKMMAIPSMPTSTPATLRQVIGSAARYRCANGRPKSGTVALSSAASPEGMYCSPQKTRA